MHDKQAPILSEALKLLLSLLLVADCSTKNCNRFNHLAKDFSFIMVCILWHFDMYSKLGLPSGFCSISMSPFFPKAPDSVFLSYYIKIFIHHISAVCVPAEEMKRDKLNYSSAKSTSCVSQRFTVYSLS